MGLDDFEFLGGESPGLVENRFRDRDLADVVEGARHADEGDVLAKDRVTVRLGQKPFQQHLGEDADVEDMQAAFGVAEFDDVRKDRDHELVIVLPLVELVRDRGGELLLLREKHDCVLDAAEDDLAAIGGTGDVIDRAEVIGLLHRLGSGLGRDHDDRDFLDVAELVHRLEDLDPIHRGHDDVKEHDGDLPAACPTDLESLAPVLRLEGVVIPREHGRKDDAVDFLVIDDQDGFPFGFLRHIRPLNVSYLSLILNPSRVSRNARV